MLSDWAKGVLRARELRALAHRAGFNYLGDVVPDVTLISTPFARASRFWNVMEGRKGSTEIVCFDCRVGRGKHSWRRTVIATRAEGSQLTAASIDSSLTEERAGEWTFIYEPQGTAGFFSSGLMLVGDVEAYLVS